MHRAGTLLAVLAILSAAALYTARALLFNLVYVVVFTLLVSFLWAWSNVRWVRVSRTLVSQRTQVGKQMEERFVVYNAGLLPKLWLEIRDESTLPGYQPSQVLDTIPPRHERGWVANALCHKRGRYRLGPARLTSGDPLGLFQFRRQLGEVHHLTVYPLTIPLSHLALPMGQLTGGDVLRQRTHYITPSVASVREYVPGDSFNRIHWPTSARKGHLFVKEFELDPATDVWIVLDLQADVQAADPAAEMMPEAEPAVLHLDQKRPVITPTTEEYGVTIAASLARHFLARHRSVGLVAYGQHRDIVQTDRGIRQLTRLLESLAVLRAEGQMPIHEVLAMEHTLFGPGTTVVAISPSPDERWLGALRALQDRGARPVAVMIHAPSFDVRLSGTVVSTASLLTSSIPTFRVEKGDDLAEVLASSRR